MCVCVFVYVCARAWECTCVRARTRTLASTTWLGALQFSLTVKLTANTIMSLDKCVFYSPVLAASFRFQRHFLGNSQSFMAKTNQVNHVGKPKASKVSKFHFRSSEHSLV